MRILSWILIAFFSFLTGFFIVQYMVQPPAQIGLYAVFLSVTVGSTLFVLVRKRAEFRGRKMFLVVLLSVLVLISGYSLANAAFLAQNEERELPGFYVQTEAMVIQQFCISLMESHQPIALCLG